MNTDVTSPTDVLTILEQQRLTLCKRVYDNGLSLPLLRRLFFVRYLVSTGRLTEWPAPQEVQI